MRSWTFFTLLLASGFAGAQDVPGPSADELAHLPELAPSASASESMSPFQAGILALKGEHPQEAIDHLTRELATHPENGKAWYYRGVCHSGTGKVEAALADFDRALELMPGDANALLRRSEAHLADRSYDAARKDLNAVLQMHASGPIAEHALMSLGELHMRQGDHAGAIIVYDRSIALAPEDARGWFNRGIAHAHNDEHQLAFEDLSKAIKLDGWMLKAYASRAIELVHLDRKPEACLDLAKAKELGDDSVDELRAIYCE